jgi:DNA polymerase-3 subunit gamma/tau
MNEEELYKKHRPLDFPDVLGQQSAVGTLSKLLAKSFPHSLILGGNSGCGKTTIARILRRKLRCHRRDFMEINCADARGIDMVREIRLQMNMAPFGGKVRIYYLDEAHMLTKEGQTALLKMLEDTPRHVYFILASTDYMRLLLTIRTRCTIVKVALLDDEVMERLLRVTAKKEKVKLKSKVISRIVELAEGSARKGMVLLHQVYGLGNSKAMLRALAGSDTRSQGIELARLLIQPRPSWSACVKILKVMEDEPETVRRIMISYASSVMKNNERMAPRCSLLIEVFGTNFYDSGEAGLTASCYAVAVAK